MIKIFRDLEEFKKEIELQKIDFALDTLLKLDFPFFEKYDKFTLINIPTYHKENPQNIIVVSKNKTLVYSCFNFNNYKDNFKHILKKPQSESTIILFLTLKQVLKSYSQQFEIIRKQMNELDLEPILEDIEESGRALRRLTDRLEGLMQLIIMLKDSDIKEFDPELISFDYDILGTETRYWLERCRSHIYRIASLRAKSQMKSSEELNNAMSKLTVIITFLTIISIVVAVPGAIGAILGIPAFSDVYFTDNVFLLMIILGFATLFSLALGFLYWKSLGLKYKK